MSKKTLLEEGTVRQFMKLANLKPLASGFITETYGDDELYEQEEEELEGEELPPEAGEEMPMDMEMGAEEEGGALEGVSEEAVEELISVVADALASATGVSIDVAGDEEGMDDFAPASELEGEEELEDIDMVDTDAVMQETYRRVAHRLSGMNKQHKLVESVTNRIMYRLRGA